MKSVSRGLIISPDSNPKFRPITPDSERNSLLIYTGLNIIVWHIKFHLISLITITEVTFSAELSIDHLTYQSLNVSILAMKFTSVITVAMISWLAGNDSVVRCDLFGHARVPNEDEGKPCQTFSDCDQHPKDQSCVSIVDWMIVSKLFNTSNSYQFGSGTPAGNCGGEKCVRGEDCPRTDSFRTVCVSYFEWYCIIPCILIYLLIINHG